MISQTVEYALRATVYLASQDGTAKSTADIATVTGVPRAYLSKVLQSLVKAGFIHSQRGVGGGMVLVKPPSEISILEIINVVDPICRIHECPLGLATHGKNLCPLHRRLDDSMAMVEEAFRESTLDEILALSGESIPLCEFPPEEKSVEPPSS